MANYVMRSSYSMSCFVGRFAMLAFMISSSSPASAWIIVNDWQDAAHIECFDGGSGCTYFGNFDKYIGLGLDEACPGDDWGCGHGNGAQLKINKSGWVCADIILGNKVPAYGKVRIYKDILGRGKYDIYNNAGDPEPSVKGIPFGQQGGLFC